MPARGIFAFVGMVGPGTGGRMGEGNGGEPDAEVEKGRFHGCRFRRSNRRFDAKNPVPVAEWFGILDIIIVFTRILR
jgi:hypothetical protein